MNIISPHNIEPYVKIDLAKVKYIIRTVFVFKLYDEEY